MFYVLVVSILIVAMRAAVVRRSMPPFKAVAPAAAIGFIFGVAILLLFSVSGWRGGSNEWLLASAAVLAAGIASAFGFALLALVAYFAARLLLASRA